jgi:hypothetical protein
MSVYVSCALFSLVKLAFQPAGYSFSTLWIVIEAVPQTSFSLFSSMKRYHHPPIDRGRF